MTPDTRTAVILDAAKRYAVTRSHIDIAPELATVGIDLIRDPAAMAAVSVIADSLMYGVRVPGAWRTLGCEVPA